MSKLSQLSQRIAVTKSGIKVAVKSEIKEKARDIAERDELAISISEWTAGATAGKTELNEGQRKAMYLALENKFQLIQGPPGKHYAVQCMLGFV